MNKKLRIPTLALSFALLSSSVISFPGLDPIASAAPIAKKVDKNTLRENAQKFREKYGMDTSTAHIEKAIEPGVLSDELEVVMGTPLTKDERKLYDKRMEQSQQASDLQEYSRKSNKGTYAGTYFDSKNGSTHIQLAKKNDVENVKSMIKSNAKLPENVVFEEVSFSEDELLSAFKIIEDVMSQYKIRSVGINVYHNKVEVETMDYSDKNIAQIKSLVPISEMLEVKAAQGSVRLDDDETAYPTQVSGEKIVNNDGIACTAGFFGYTSQGDKLLITAGHCGGIGSTQAVKQPTATIGNWLWRNWNQNGGPALTADVGVIKINTSNIAAAVPYPNGNGSNLTPFNGAAGAPTIGQTIYVRGAKTGALTQGVVVSVLKTVDFGGGEVCGGNWNISNLIQHMAAQQQGDSGGPVLLNYQWTPAKNGYTFQPVGMVTGQTTGGNKYASYLPEIIGVLSNAGINYSGLYLGP
ncbi:S1 family peptidase [Paenibacillus filicis]|uniref:S1 family peptidase n=1 Tax=Paenibacillus filicis TaxID=669464 RepID=A0ABU9DF42_9BACL